MAKITLICGDSGKLTGSADLMLTDPPFELPGKKLAEIICRYSVQHLVLITTMRQFLEFSQHTAFHLAFDFVLDGVVPKKSKSPYQPHYTHQTVAYMKKEAVPSAFDRKRRQRSDQYSTAPGYWPTVIRGPREGMGDHGMKKNINAITDILGSFAVRSVIDPFAGIGTVGIAAADLDIECVLIERNLNHVKTAAKMLRFIGHKIEIEGI
jgi:hypothetical protein